MGSGVGSAWDELSAWYQATAVIPTDVAHYGPDLPDERELRLCGELKGRRVLELGCGAAQSAISFAKAGAKAIGVDASAAQLAYGRKLAEAEEVRVELHHGDMADIGFLTSASVDLVFSAMSLQYVDDVNRVFRQVHRVLKTDAPFVFSVPHPAAMALDQDGKAITLARSMFDRSPLTRKLQQVSVTEYPRSISSLFTSLQRANFRVDVIVEPEPVGGRSHSALWKDLYRSVPPALVMRARKLGV